MRNVAARFGYFSVFCWVPLCHWETQKVGSDIQGGETFNKRMTGPQSTWRWIQILDRSNKIPENFAGGFLLQNKPAKGSKWNLLTEIQLANFGFSSCSFISGLFIVIASKKWGLFFGDPWIFTLVSQGQRSATVGFCPVYCRTPARMWVMERIAMLIVLQAMWQKHGVNFCC